MSRYNDYDENDQDRWERDHDYELIWKCPNCGYEYSSPSGINEAMPCNSCGCKTEQAGEKYTS